MKYSVLKLSQKCKLTAPGYAFPIYGEGSATIAGQPFSEMTYFSEHVEIQPTVLIIWIY